MNTQDFLKNHFRLLLLQFGRRAVLEALAAADDMPEQQLESEIAALRAAKTSKSAKKLRRPLEDILAGLHGIPAERLNIVGALARLYEAKQFLPDLRDTEDFLHQKGATRGKHKSRKDALPAIVGILASLPQLELERLLSHVSGSSESSDYALLANQLMGKPH